MDKTMFKGYVRELVREAVREELDRLIDKKINEALSIRPTPQPVVKEAVQSPGASPAARPSRAQLAQILGLDRIDSETVVASTDRLMLPETAPAVNMADPMVNSTVKAINRDYSALMKKLV